VLSGSAGIMALSALAVSVYQAYTSRQQQKVSAWPYVSIVNTGAGGYGRIVQNVGLGPALVRSFVVEVDGRPYHAWRDVARAALGADSVALAAALAEADTGVYTATLGRGVVILPGAMIEVVHAPPGPLATLLRRALNDRQTRMRVCYCSLYGDCWTAGAATEPVPTDRCPDDPAREFGE
jgi:hypothetical protein